MENLLTKFLRPKSEIAQTILVVSDLHLSAGSVVHGRYNFLEDFFADQEFCEFLDYYSSGEYRSRAVELVINGDFLDFLAVPFVPYFDDKFWSEEASLGKLDLILAAHQEVFAALNAFLKRPNKTIVYLAGNHDGELCLPKIKEHLKGLFDPEVRERFRIIDGPCPEYRPLPAISIRHGHELEAPNCYNDDNLIVRDENGTNYFVPPWGSYYVTRVINRYKKERSYINMVRPFRKFIIHELIFDTFFILRFITSSLFYFFRVRVAFFWQQTKNFRKILQAAKQELKLYRDDNVIIDELFEEDPQTECIIRGHAHMPVQHYYPNGNVFLNTGCWTKIYCLDFFEHNCHGLLTYAQIDVAHNPPPAQRALQARLQVWNGRSNLPFGRF